MSPALPSLWMDNPKSPSPENTYSRISQSEPDPSRTAALEALYTGGDGVDLNQPGGNDGPGAKPGDGKKVKRTRRSRKIHYLD